MRVISRMRDKTCFSMTPCPTLRSLLCHLTNDFWWDLKAAERAFGSVSCLRYSIWSLAKITYFQTTSALITSQFNILDSNYAPGRSQRPRGLKHEPSSPRSNTWIVGPKSTRGMDVCVRLFYICVVLCVGSGLATGSSPVQGVLPTVCRTKKLKSGQDPKGCRAIERERERELCFCEIVHVQFI
jgi:hypothetical protein